MIESSYIFSNDPIFLLLLFFVITVGEVFHFLLGLFDSKILRLYQPQEADAIKQNLAKADKYLKSMDIQ